MDNLVYLFIPMAFLAATLGGIAIWSRRGLWIKICAVLATALFMPAAYAGLFDLLSRPKPIAFEWIEASAKEAMVLGATIREGEAIYLWLLIDGVMEPRYYVMPWSLELAQELQTVLRQARGGDGGVAMRLPFERSLARDYPIFYKTPQPAFPLKDYGFYGSGPVRYLHPDSQD